MENSEPEPDIAILIPGDNSQNHPNSAQLIIEIANTSLSFDRKKASIYAKGNVPEYVIINLIDHKMESYKSPKDGVYTEVRILSRSEEFSSNSVQGLSFSLESILS